MKNLLFAILPLLLAGCGSAGSSTSSTDAQSKAYARKSVVVDVRTPEEYSAGHVRGSTNVPIDEIRQRIGSVVPDKNAPIMVHCQAGGRSARASKELRSMGYKNVVDLGSLAHAREVVEGKH